MHRNLSWGGSAQDEDSRMASGAAVKWSPDTSMLAHRLLARGLLLLPDSLVFR
jgi:hypothetical protein